MAITKEAKEYLIANFFMVYRPSMIDPFPGYKYFYDKLISIKAEKISDQDIIDLKVWYHLAWCHAYFKYSEYELKWLDSNDQYISFKLSVIPELFQKGMNAGYGPSNFTQEESIAFILEQYQIMKFVIPVHRLLLKIGASEIITTPYSHPILPLIYDSNIGDDYFNLQLPERYFYPEDAEAQILKRY
ncbi:MAG: hypothetical protein ABIA04_15590 [Pseudomonadota bacterium]